MKPTKPTTETWKSIEFDFEYNKTTRYEISNWGRVRSFNKTSNGRILNGSKIEGYRILKLRLFRPKSEERQQDITQLKADISRLYSKRREYLTQGKSKLTIDRLTTSIEKREQKLHKIQKKNLHKRVINVAPLFHQLVAKYFLPTPKPNETTLAHLDFDKLNNSVENLKWMTPKEHQEHIRKSPYVIAEKKERKYKQKYRTRKEGYKLDSTKVLHIKKLLKRNWTLRRIAKQYNVSDMQIHRIKTGENWSHIKLPTEVPEQTKETSAPKNINDLFKA